jgi:hypothetical protein
VRARASQSGQPLTLAALVRREPGLATIRGGEQEVLEPAVLAFLNGERVLRWVKWLLL